MVPSIWKFNDKLASSADCIPSIGVCLFSHYSLGFGRLSHSGETPPEVIDFGPLQEQGHKKIHTIEGTSFEIYASRSAVSLFAHAFIL
jgi:hypothetical protein